jgi:hypothetical protein
MLSLIPGYEGTIQKFEHLDPEKDADGKPIKTTTEPSPPEWRGWLTFWLKSAYNETFATTVLNIGKCNY